MSRPPHDLPEEPPPYYKDDPGPGVEDIAEGPGVESETFSHSTDSRQETGQPQQSNSAVPANDSSPSAGDSTFSREPRDDVIWTQTDNGTWVLYGPAELLREGETIEVYRKDGSSSTETVGPADQAAPPLPEGMAMHANVSSGGAGSFAREARDDVIWSQAGNGSWALYGPAGLLHEGETIEVYRKDGSSSTETVGAPVDPGESPLPDGMAMHTNVPGSKTSSGNFPRELRTDVGWTRASDGKWALYGPAELLQEGKKVEVYRKNGSSSTEIVGASADPGESPLPEGMALHLNVSSTGNQGGGSIREVRDDVTWARAGDGKWALYGPKDIVRQGGKVVVRRKDGSISTEAVGPPADPGESPLPEGMALHSNVFSARPRSEPRDDMI